MMDLLLSTETGLYCPAGDFYVDPWRPVDKAVITHAHSDHARPGSKAYLCAEPGRGVLAERLGREARIQTLAYAQTCDMNGVKLSFHPAGHVLGSAQVRLEHQGRVWVVAGDYKTAPDPTCAAFEPVRCQVFITESTFGLPLYRWPSVAALFDEIHAWWQQNQTQGRTSLLFSYSLGKAQRVLHDLNPELGPIFIHGAVDRFLPAYRTAGVHLPRTHPAQPERIKAAGGKALVLAPPAAARSSWSAQFGAVSTGFASGWMQLRGARKRLGADRGFALSDHADWNGLLWAIAATEAERILVTHGYTSVLVRWLQEQGQHAEPLATRFEAETGASQESPAT